MNAQEERAVRSVALLATGKDSACSATRVGEWPDAAKETIIAILRGPDMYVDLAEEVLAEVAPWQPGKGPARLKVEGLSYHRAAAGEQNLHCAGRIHRETGRPLRVGADGYIRNCDNRSLCLVCAFEESHSC